MLSRSSAIRGFRDFIPVFLIIVLFSSLLFPFLPSLPPRFLFLLFLPLSFLPDTSREKVRLSKASQRIEGYNFLVGLLALLLVFLSPDI